MPPLETEKAETSSTTNHGRHHPETRVENSDEISSVVTKNENVHDTTTSTTRQSSSSHRIEDDPILKALFGLLIYLCVGMFIWIVFLPASWLFSRSQFHREVTLPWLNQIGFFWILPYSLMTKFEGHAFVEFTHILPGALWVFLIPFQLHPNFRKKYRQLHRMLGYLFVATSLSIGLAIFVLQYQKLTYDYHEPFTSLPSRFADTLQIPMTWVVTIWFCATGIQAIRFARKRQLAKHETYMLRHVAAGIWVSTQRMIIFPLVQLTLSVYITSSPKVVSNWLRRELFGGTANAAMIITALVAEFAIHRISKLRQQQQQQPHATSSNYVPKTKQKLN